LEGLKYSSLPISHVFALVPLRFTSRSLQARRLRSQQDASFSLPRFRHLPNFAKVQTPKGGRFTPDNSPAIYCWDQAQWEGQVRVSRRLKFPRPWPTHYFSVVRFTD